MSDTAACKHKIWSIRYWRLVYLLYVWFGITGCQSSSPAPQLVLVNPIIVDGNPYRCQDEARLEAGASLLQALPQETDRSAVCALTYLNQDRYRLDTFPDDMTAQRIGATVTHHGACGTCSSLQDLAVYQSQSDLTASVRRCALVSWLKPLALYCLERLGFTAGCAETWFYNMRHTARHCTGVCLRAWWNQEPYNDIDGGLNACLACDEEKSGPRFKEIAGRTRRNSGIVSEIDRPSEEIAPLPQP